SLYTTARTGFYTLALHDALPILRPITSDGSSDSDLLAWPVKYLIREYYGGQGNDTYVLNRYQSAVEYGDEGIDTVRSLVGQKLRSEEHTSELQSRENLVCRLLLE